MPLHLASLGSSFASGPGISPIVDENAGRSAANYGALLAEHIGAAKFTDLTVAGATLLNLTIHPQVIQDSGHVFPPQITQLPPDADIVLVLGGGNDIGYIGGFFVDAARRLPWLRKMMGLPADSTPEDVPPLEGIDPEVLNPAGLTGRYAEILDAIHARAPNAHVLVVEYLAMLSPHTKPEVDVPFTAEQIRHHEEACQIVDTATSLALTAGGRDRRTWCSLVPVAEVSRAGHAIGSAEPWVCSVTPELVERMGAFHPNAEGMKAVEKLVYQKLLDLGKITK